MFYRHNYVKYKSETYLTVHSYRKLLKRWILFPFFPSETYKLFQPSIQCLLVHMPAGQASVLTSHAGLYAMIEGSSKLPGPAMHPCGQLNRPPPNLRSTISEAPYRALLSTSFLLSEALKLMHTTPLLVKLHFSKK